MKKQLLITSLLCVVTTTENYAKHGKNIHKNSTSSTAIVNVPQQTQVDVPAILQEAQTRYRDAIAALREGTKISRSDIIKLLKNDPYLVREKTTDGHAKFSHTIFTVTFCVQAHNTTDITGATERRGHHKALQVYVNTLVRLMHDKSVNPVNDWQAVWKAQATAFDNYVNNPQKK